MAKGIRTFNSILTNDYMYAGVTFPEIMVACNLPKLNSLILLRRNVSSSFLCLSGPVCPVKRRLASTKARNWDLWWHHFVRYPSHINSIMGSFYSLMCPDLPVS